MGWAEDTFHLSSRGTDFWTEVRAGTSTYVFHFLVFGDP